MLRSVCFVFQYWKEKDVIFGNIMFIKYYIQKQFLDIILSDQHHTAHGDMSQCWVLCPCVMAQVKETFTLQPCIQD